MTVGELMAILRHVDHDRIVYVPDSTDQTAQPVSMVVNLQHVNTQVPGVSIPDDVALIPFSMVDLAKTGD